MNNTRNEVKDKPTISVKPHGNTPTVEEMHVDMRIGCLPEELALAVLRPVTMF
ncbi:MAG: hypothetical protein OXF56_12710 [Rhodobacteraceae bacterium]|nr:hypothetical protein [Paracoccaceae bacterium]